MRPRENNVSFSLCVGFFVLSHVSCRSWRKDDCKRRDLKTTANVPRSQRECRKTKIYWNYRAGCGVWGVGVFACCSISGKEKNIFLFFFFVRFIGVDLFFNDVNIRCGATTF